MRGRYCNLLEQIDLCKPKTIMEIGTWNGHHALEMIERAERYNDNVLYTGFDLFEDFDASIIEHCPKKPAFLNSVKIYLRNKKAALIKGNTKATIKEFHKKQDFIFIDGGHSLATIKSDWENIQRLMHKDTVVIFDDFYVGNYELGCNRLVTNLDRTIYSMEYLQPVEKFQKNEWIQYTQMIKVTFR